MKKLLMTALASAVLASAIAAEPPKRELRSTWIATVWGIDWPKSTNKTTAQKQMTDMLDALQQHNFTGVCFQVRGLADALYKSSYEPWSSAMGTRGKDPGWDPLEFVVDECHKRGMECYAWVNPYRQRTSATNYTTAYDKQWEADGWLLSNGTYTVFNPGMAETRAHILNVIKEIYTNYAIDGMLFDDYFYPSGGTALGSGSPDYDLWKSAGTTLSQADWRRKNVNDFMHEIYTAIQADRPDLRFGISPAGVSSASASKYGLSKPAISASDWQYDQIYSDPLAWMSEKSLDFISPQIYWLTTNSSAPFGPLTAWWSKAADKLGSHFYSSHSISLLVESNTQANWADLAKQVELHRQGQADYSAEAGEIFYSAKNIDGYGNSAVSGLGDYLEQNVYTRKSLVPRVDWKPRTTYSAPSSFKRTDNTLSWTATTGAAKAIIRYSLYAIPSNINFEQISNVNGDGIDGKYLLDVVYGSTYTIPADKASGYYFALCVYDGYGYESAATLQGYIPVEPIDPDDSDQPGIYEPGYAVVTDPAEYGVSNLGIESLWMRTVTMGNFATESSGSLNRSLAADASKVYLSGRAENSASSEIYLSVYNATTGEHERDLRLSAAGQASYYPCNDVFTDSKGNVCISNLTLNCATAPLIVHRVNTSTGSLAEVASLTATDGGRIDHAAVYGDVESGDFYVFAAVANTAKVYRWHISEGSGAASPDVMTAKAFHPSSATAFTIAPRVFPVSEARVYVDGATTASTLYDFATGKITDSAATAFMPSVEGNGQAYFTLGLNNLAVFANGLNSHHIVSAQTGNVLSDGKLYWTVPEATLGDVNSTTGSAPVVAVPVSETEARVYTYSPGNGLAAYKITDLYASGIISPKADVPAVQISIYGHTAILSQSASWIKAYTTTGLLAAEATGSEILLPAAGTYIIVTPDAAAKVNIAN